MIVEKNKVIQIRYQATDEQGKVVDSNIDFEPLEYIHGHGHILQGLEDALSGLSIDQHKQIELSPQQAYGDFVPELVVEVPKDRFPEGADQLQLGTEVQSSDGVRLMVTDIDADKVILDGNHPLAGKTLNFSVTIVGIRNPTEEELQPLQHEHNSGGCGSGCGCKH